MTSRLLPREEWHRLEPGIRDALAHFDPELTRVVVVEHEGEIVGNWVVTTLVHLEGAWVHPEYRKRASVARRLLKATMAEASKGSPRWVMTGAETQDVADLLTKHLKAVHVPMDTYIVPMENVCR